MVHAINISQNILILNLLHDQDRTGNFSLKFTKIPDQYSRLSMWLFFIGGSIAIFNTTNSGDDTL